MLRLLYILGFISIIIVGLGGVLVIAICQADGHFTKKHYRFLVVFSIALGYLLFWQQIFM